MCYLFQGLRSELLLDDACSLNNASVSEVDGLLPQDVLSNAIVIKGSISCGKVS